MGDDAQRILVAGGGTGGHVNPALAIVGELRRRDPGRRFLFVGTDRGLEARLVPAAGYRLETLRASGLVGMGPAARLRGLARLPLGLLDAFRILRRFRPHLVLGVGGYSSGPMLLAAALGGRRTMIHEQNRRPGVTNRILAPLVDRIALSFEGTAGAIGRRGTVTGNPIRAELAAIPAWKAPRGTPHVLVFGGSRGARALNDAMIAGLPALRHEVTLHHQTGPADEERVRAAYTEAGLSEARIEAYIEDMAAAVAAADLVVCRAGASTLAELAAAGRPSLLVPFPQAAHDHQRHNAGGFAAGGAARMLEQRELDPELHGDRLAQEILALTSAPEALERMAAAARQLARPDAAARIADMAEGLLPRRETA